MENVFLCTSPLNPEPLWGDLLNQPHGVETVDVSCDCVLDWHHLLPAQVTSVHRKWPHVTDFILNDSFQFSSGSPPSPVVGVKCMLGIVSVHISVFSVWTYGGWWGQTAAVWYYHLFCVLFSCCVTSCFILVIICGCRLCTDFLSCVCGKTLNPLDSDLEQDSDSQTLTAPVSHEQTLQVEPV